MKCLSKETAHRYTVELDGREVQDLIDVLWVLFNTSKEGDKWHDKALGLVRGFTNVRGPA